MPQQYAASDGKTGLRVQVTGDFPDDPDDRVRIARTTNLFTRLMSTILSTTSDAERRERFRAIETQLEVADALVRGDIAEVQRLVRETMRQMGVTDEQLADVERQLREQLETMGAQGLEGLFGLDTTPPSDEPEPQEPLAQPREDWLPDDLAASDEPIPMPSVENSEDLGNTEAAAPEEPAESDPPDAGPEDQPAEDDEQSDQRS